MSFLESALRDLEVATAALGEVPADDMGQVSAALELRSKAIARVAGLATDVLALPPAERDGVVQRLRYASGAGELAQLKLSGGQRNMMAEWRHWNRINRSLEAGSAQEAKKVDCRG
jgi:hypothetical protein